MFSEINFNLKVPSRYHCIASGSTSATQASKAVPDSESDSDSERLPVTRTPSRSRNPT